MKTLELRQMENVEAGGGYSCVGMVLAGVGAVALTVFLASNPIGWLALAQIAGASSGMLALADGCVSQ